MEISRVAIAGQQETVRKKAEEDLTLATFGVNICFCVGFLNKAGKRSLTHVDIGTDMGFVEREMKWMQHSTENPAKVLIGRVNEKDILTSNLLIATLQKHGLPFEHQKLDKRAMIWPEEENRFIPYEEDRFFDYVCDREAHIQHVKASVRTLARQLSLLVNPHKEDLPPIAYEGGEKRLKVGLSTDVQRVVRQLTPLVNNEGKFAEAVLDIFRKARIRAPIARDVEDLRTSIKQREDFIPIENAMNEGRDEDIARLMQELYEKNSPSRG